MLHHIRNNCWTHYPQHKRHLKQAKKGRREEILNLRRPHRAYKLFTIIKSGRDVTNSNTFSFKRVQCFCNDKSLYVCWIRIGPIILSQLSCYSVHRFYLQCRLCDWTISHINLAQPKFVKNWLSLCGVQLLGQHTWLEMLFPSPLNSWCNAEIKYVLGWCNVAPTKINTTKTLLLKNNQNRMCLIT